MNSFTLCWQGQPIAAPQTQWQIAADIALDHGFAIRVMGVIFTLIPGASIRKS